MHFVARKIDGREIIIDSGSPPRACETDDAERYWNIGTATTENIVPGVASAGNTRNYIARLDAATGLLVIGAEERDELVALRQEALQAMGPKSNASNEAVFRDASNSPASVQYYGIGSLG